MGVERQCEVEVLTQSKRDLQWVQKQLSIISNRTNGPARTKDKVSLWVNQKIHYRNIDDHLLCSFVVVVWTITQHFIKALCFMLAWFSFEIKD